MTIASLLVSFGIFAAEPPTTWKQLSDYSGPALQVRVFVHNKPPRQIEGNFVRIAEPKQLVLAVDRGGERSIKFDAIARLQTRAEKSGSRKTGLAVGAVLGGVLGVLGAAISDRPAGTSAAGAYAIAVPVYAAGFGAIGYLWGRSIDRRWHDVALTP